MLYSMRNLLQDAYKNKYAVPAINFETFELLEGAIQGAYMAKSPLIVQTTWPAVKYMGLENILFMTNSYAVQYKVPVVLHLDHGENFEVIKECIDAGYKSVMIDCSEKGCFDNITMTNKVISYANNFNVTVEAEIGVVGYEGVSSEKTQVDEAIKFLKETKVSSLGVSIGNFHGGRVKERRIDFGLLEMLYQNIQLPLVLHGSSGVIDSDLALVKNYGICKVNIETEIRLLYKNEILKFYQDNPTEIRPRNLMTYLKAQVAEGVSKKCHILGSSGKSDSIVKQS